VKTIIKEKITKTPLREKMTELPLGAECKFYGCDMHTYDILLRLHMGGNYGTEEVYEDRIVA